MSSLAVPWTVLADYRCFGCSKDNPSGLQLEFRKAQRRLNADFVLGRDHESYPGVVHGGLAGVICDEAMGNLAVLESGRPAFTMSMRLIFVAPLAVGATYSCTAEVRESSNGQVRASAEIHDDSGEIMVTATANYQLAELADARKHIKLTDQEAAALSRVMTMAKTEGEQK